MAAAAQWTRILINMTADNVETSMGELGTGLSVSSTPVSTRRSSPTGRRQKLRSQTSGQVESVSIGSSIPIWNASPDSDHPPTELPPELASRTDTVLVVATSVSENEGTKSAEARAPTGPITVRWNLRLGSPTSAARR